MASKGDKGFLEPQALRLYADGASLTSIASILDVSVTSLARWKSDSKKPSATMDEWDRTRAQKKGNIMRLRDLFDEQLGFMEGLAAVERTAPMMDTLSKIGALLERWDKLEKARKVAAEVATQVRDAGLTDETVEDIRWKILGVAK